VFDGSTSEVSILGEIMASVLDAAATAATVVTVTAATDRTIGSVDGRHNAAT